MPYRECPWLGAEAWGSPSLLPPGKACKDDPTCGRCGAKCPGSELSDPEHWYGVVLTVLLAGRGTSGGA